MAMNGQAMTENLPVGVPMWHVDARYVTRLRETPVGDSSNRRMKRFMKRNMPMNMVI